MYKAVRALYKAVMAVYKAVKTLYKAGKAVSNRPEEGERGAAATRVKKVLLDDERR